MRTLLVMFVVSMFVVGCEDKPQTQTHTVNTEKIHLEFIPTQEDSTQAKPFACRIHTGNGVYVIEKLNMEQFMLQVRSVLVKHSKKTLCVHMTPFPGEGVFLRIEEGVRDYAMIVGRVSGAYPAPGHE